LLPFSESKIQKLAWLYALFSLNFRIKRNNEIQNSEKTAIFNVFNIGSRISKNAINYKKLINTTDYILFLAFLSFS